MTSPIERFEHLFENDWSTSRCRADNGTTYLWVGDGATGHFVLASDITAKDLDRFDAERADPDAALDAYSNLCDYIPALADDQIPPEVLLQAHRALGHEPLGWRCVSNRYDQDGSVLYDIPKDFKAMCVERFGSAPELRSTDFSERCSDGEGVVLEPVYAETDSVCWGM